MLTEVSLPAATLRRALDGVHRAALAEASHPLSRVYLSYRAGRLQLCARDHHRLHHYQTEAVGQGRTSVSLERGDAYRLSDEITGKEVRLTFTEERLCLGRVSVLVTPADFPQPGDPNADAGCIMERHDLLEVVSKVAAEEVSLVTGGEGLRVNTSLVPLAYRTHARMAALLDRDLLHSALRAGDSSEVLLESFGAEGPVRLESGGLVAWIAQRSPEPLL